MILFQIPWNPDPILVDLFGMFQLRYYSLLFVSGLLLGYYAVKRMYRLDNKNTEELEQLAVYVFSGVILGARLGHCLFYEPGYYLSHPLEMLLPVKFSAAGMKFTGFQGLASHGGALGVMIAVWLYSRKTKVNYLWVADRLAIATALTACFIRLGNFMNSEILGAPSDVPWAVIFSKVDMLPRHPAQLYEAVAYLITFGILSYLFATKRKQLHDGFFFGLSLVMVLVARILIEFLKRDQVAFEADMFFNMGQILSLPMIAAGIWLIFRKNKKPQVNTK